MNDRIKRHAVEKNEILKVIQSMEESIPEPYKLHRIGKYSPGKNRPIKIYFKSSETVKLILRNKHKYPNFQIYPDQTHMQRQYYKELKKELNRRKENGEAELRIKYVNGHPKIVRQSKNVQLYPINSTQ